MTAAAAVQWLIPIAAVVCVAIHATRQTSRHHPPTPLDARIAHGLQLADGEGAQVVAEAERITREAVP